MSEDPQDKMRPRPLQDILNDTCQAYSQDSLKREYRCKTGVAIVEQFRGTEGNGERAQE